MVKPIKLNPEDVKAFWSRVKKRGKNECWGWDGAHDKDGYPVFHRTIGWYKAHRVACFLAHGDAGKMTCHTCNNPGCVNPKHLYPGTGKDNARDRDKIPHGIHGERQHLAVLTNAQVLKIVSLKALGTASKDIAKELGVRRRLVYRVCGGECWGWLTGLGKSSD